MHFSACNYREHNSLYAVGFTQRLIDTELQRHAETRRCRSRIRVPLTVYSSKKNRPFLWAKIPIDSVDLLSCYRSAIL